MSTDHILILLKRSAKRMPKETSSLLIGKGLYKSTRYKESEIVMGETFN
jgi:hypothetical protein